MKEPHNSETSRSRGEHTRAEVTLLCRVTSVERRPKMTAQADHTLDTYRTMVLDEWTDEATIAGYRKWYRGNTIQLQPMTEMTIKATQIYPGMHVLDLASGTGQPALTIARLVGPDGHVTATDLSAGMLALAQEH